MTNEPDVETVTTPSRFSSACAVPPDEANPDTVTSVFALLVDSVAAEAEKAGAQLDWTTVDIASCRWFGDVKLGVSVRAAS